MTIKVMASGMVTCVGFNAPASCTAIRAGISGIDEIPYTEYIGGDDYLRGGKVALPQWYDGINKLADMVSPAIDECLRTVPSSQWHQIPILLGTRLQDTPNLPSYRMYELLHQIELRLQLPHHQFSQLLSYGQTSGVYALQLAKSLMTEHQLPYCIVAGVDSYLDRHVVQHYLDKNRLLCSSQSNGFLPGEAGSAVLVMLSNKKQAGLHILGIGQASEPAPYLSEKPFMAQGMTQAIRLAKEQSNIKLGNVLYSLSDISGERYKFKEFSYANGRFNSPEECVSPDPWTPTEFIGETGAAIIPILLGVALDANLNSYAPSREVLIHVGNDNDERAALLLKYQE
ncbi:hypothetical protein [Pragia fontium]|uniref:hypothetical protein n=1 Tax=Pragia fontium TaxID=82985 RepID=UPI000F711427|nr:hypothetical protein [Pragia fontium]VEJ56333.1 3-oxoacyl-(acyl carrier protein) synthase [Pragia fontium]